MATSGLADGLDLVFDVLVDVDDDVAGGEFAQTIELELLGAADAGHGLDTGLGMNAVVGASDQPVGQPEVEQKLRQAGHQRDDARLRGRPVRHPQGVDPGSVHTSSFLQNAPQNASSSHTSERTVKARRPNRCQYLQYRRPRGRHFGENAICVGW